MILDFNFTLRAFKQIAVWSLLLISNEIYGDDNLQCEKLSQRLDSVVKLVGHKSKIIAELCNENVQKTIIKKMKNIHICRDMKLDPSLKNDLALRNQSFRCEEKLQKYNLPRHCDGNLNPFTEKLVNLHHKIINSKTKESPADLHKDLLTIFISRLIIGKERAAGRGAVGAMFKNNIPSIASGLIYEQTGFEISDKRAYLVCIEQTYRFLESPEGRYLTFNDYTLDVYDQTKKSDTSGKTAHAFTLLTAPDGNQYIFDPWKGESGDFAPEKFTQYKGVRKQFQRKKHHRIY